MSPCRHPLDCCWACSLTAFDCLENQLGQRILENLFLSRVQRFQRTGARLPSLWFFGGAFCVVQLCGQGQLEQHWLAQIPESEIMQALNSWCSLLNRLNMLRVIVALTSGRSESLSLSESSKVGDLKALAQESFKKRFLQLVTAEGRILTDTSALFADAGLRDGEHLTAIVGQPKMAATDDAFALWCCGSNGVVTWGYPDSGGDSSAVQDQLRKVQQIQATESAFAAILEDGSVVTWGYPDSGGDSSAAQDLLASL